MALITVPAEQVKIAGTTFAQGGLALRGSVQSQAQVVHSSQIAVDPYVVEAGTPHLETGLGPAMVFTCYQDPTGVVMSQLLPPGVSPDQVAPPPVPAADGTAVATPTTYTVVKPAQVTYQYQPPGTPPAPPGVPAAKVILPPGTGKPGQQTANMTQAPVAGNPGSDYRFLPLAVDFSGGLWSAHKATKLYPKIKLVTQPGKSNDPLRDQNYYYVQHHPTEHINAPALQLNGHGFLQVVTGSATNAMRQHCTFLMVFIPHHGPGAFYPILSSARQTANGALKRMEFRYVKGAVWLYYGTKVVKKWPSSLNLGEPCIFAYSWNGTNASVHLWDRSKQAANVSTKGTYYWDLNGDIGAGPVSPGSSSTDYTNMADMDILEIDMWELALTDAQLLTAMAHLAHLYGVGRH